MLAPVLPVFDSVTSIEYFQFENDVARVRVAACAAHKATGLEFIGSYRQIMHFKGYKISRLQEFHDAAMLNAFWQMVAAETARLVP